MENTEALYARITELELQFEEIRKFRDQFGPILNDISAVLRRVDDGVTKSTQTVQEGREIVREATLLAELDRKEILAEVKKMVEDGDEWKES